MPHKRAKRSIREKLRAEKKSDLPPSHGLLNDDMPKSMARILNAEATQKAWRERKRLAEEGGDLEGRHRKKRKTQGESEKANQSAIQIKPGESLRHFNRRVEDDMRPLVRTAMKNTTSVSKQKAKASERDDTHVIEKKGKQKVDDDSENEDDANNHSHKSKAKEPAKDFAQSSSSKPKRLNDIVLAPPDLKVAPRLKRLADAAQNKARKRSEDKDNAIEVDDNEVVSIAQKRMMELERDKAIRHYRALKEARAKGLRANVLGVQ